MSKWPRLERSAILGVLTDIDDTLTTRSLITPDALQALADLKAAGLHVIAVTGRSVGWSAPFAQTWPVDAIVAENGAVLLQRAGTKLQPDRGDIAPLSKSYQQGAATRAANFSAMMRTVQRVLREVPQARLSDDSAGRETDIAIDHSEWTNLSAQDITKVVDIMQAEGMNATVSSIHVNGWFGNHNKLEGARWAVRVLLGRNLDEELDRWVYVGDSTNDQLMFQTFPHSIGVANVAHFASRLMHLPRYVTLGERGAGFTEVVQALLAARC